MIGFITCAVPLMVITVRVDNYVDVSIDNLIDIFSNTSWHFPALFVSGNIQGSILYMHQ